MLVPTDIIVVSQDSVDHELRRHAPSVRAQQANAGAA
jgi:hypothetical protein